MLRKTVKAYETFLLIVFIATTLPLMYFTPLAEFIFNLSWKIEVRLHEISPQISAILSSIIIYIPAALFFFLFGGLFFQRNNGLYGIICFTPIAILISLSFTDTQKFTLHLLGTLTTFLIFYLTGSVSGKLLSSFSSPIPSQRWPQRSLKISTDLKPSFLITIDTLIVISLLTAIGRTIFPTDHDPKFQSLTMLALLTLLLGLLFIRKGKIILGMAIYLSHYIAYSAWAAANSETVILYVKILYTANPLTFLKYILEIIAVVLVVTFSIGQHRHKTNIINRLETKEKKERPQPNIYQPPRPS